ncbi:PKD domain-containing protein, partial [Algoriphagus sp.]|uniref:Ig-like domain-containing protein n=1 Tax=Algoriphagus sp. TaxID=1872435 RepID=UPI00272F2158
MDRLSNCQMGLSSQNERLFSRGWSKIPLWEFFFGMVVLFMALIPLEGYSQDGIRPPYPGCPQNNVNVTRIDFFDEEGDPFDPLVEYPLGTEVSGQIFFTFGGSTSNAYSMYTQYDVFINDQFSETVILCLFQGQTVVKNTATFVDDFTWEWGDKFEIKNIFMRWETGNPKNVACGDGSGGNAQCYGNEAGFLVNTPLVPNFNFETNCTNFEVKFTDATVGGNLPYKSRNWNFAGLGSSSLQNPTFTFPSAGSYNVTLTVVDQLNITKSVTKTVDLFNALGLSFNKIDDDCSDVNTGSIDLNVAGGLAPYTYLWSKTGDAGYSFDGQDPTGLSAGTYSVTVTDSRECTAITTVTIVRPIQSESPNPQTFEFCEGSGDQLLSVSPATGYIIKWYDSEMNPLQVAPTVSTSSAGTESFYITQFKDGECESEMAEVTVTINPAPAAPTSPVNVTICEGDAESITASATVPQGFSIVWYTTADGDVTTESPSLSTVGTITY